MYIYKKTTKISLVTPRMNIFFAASLLLSIKLLLFMYQYCTLNHGFFSVLLHVLLSLLNAIAKSKGKQIAFKSVKSNNYKKKINQRGKETIQKIKQRRLRA